VAEDPHEEIGEPGGILGLAPALGLGAQLVASAPPSK
jgi:hypothetical protein